MKNFYTFVAVAMTAFTVNAQNLLQNPSFESGFDNWTKGYTDPTIENNGGKEGSKYAIYKNQSVVTGFYQDIPIEGGKYYVLSFYYRSSAEQGTRLWSGFKKSSSKKYSI